MCRLFALAASPEEVRATFWLLDASDSFVSQSRRNPDGTGLGYYDEDGKPVLDKQPLAAFADEEFRREAKQISSMNFVSHIRFATTGPKTPENCHPFEMDGRLFAHNGMIGGLDRLEGRLGDARSLIKGQTDSERLFALITKEIRENKGDIPKGIAAAVRWVVDNIPVCSINFVLTTPNEMWAFRYPETDKLYVLERPAGGHRGERPLHYVSTTLRVHSHHLGVNPSVVVASEPLDDNPAWRLLRVGELIRVTPELTVQSKILIDGPPAFPFRPEIPMGEPDSAPAAAHLH